ncbi:uncharacterized protein LY89DRAFT_239324 [Mollisia scopiformis]|uniref:C2H2-type domain-containing protein n=1 Tax=Mollisia scopiformis TaxID=149040 RepID=A0A194WTA8_MOLSC|nr:uncharacterized protein LY89DRAFT_239324 [Mollisia scopiformis]KUJ11186.1 hypothetical protein LY89DRAFT_239324 [Mollisia scopiformis]
MKAKESWWLSTFYSFCIQATVRRVLLQLQNSPRSELAAKQYLQLAVRLFATISANYDPLMRDYASFNPDTSAKGSRVSDFRDAQLVIQQSSWASKGIDCSAIYLMQLFDDDWSELAADDIVPIYDEPIPVPELSSPFADPCVDLDSLGASNWAQDFGLYQSFSPKPYRPSSLSSMESVDNFTRITFSLPAADTKNHIPQERTLHTCDYHLCTVPSFPTLAGLKSHLRDHAENVVRQWKEKQPSRCLWARNCKSKAIFKTERIFRTHLENVHISPILCTVKDCQHRKPFRSRYDLERHITVFHKEASASYLYCPCTKCDQSPIAFIRKDKWLLHIQTCHEDTECPFDDCPGGINGDVCLTHSDVVTHIRKDHWNDGKKQAFT